MKKLRNTEAELKKSVAYKKSVSEKVPIKLNLDKSASYQRGA